MALIDPTRSPRVSLHFVVAALHGVASVSFVTSASIVQALCAIPEGRFGAVFLPLLLGAAVASGTGQGLVRRFGRTGTMGGGLLLAALALACVPASAACQADGAFAALLACSGVLGLGLGSSGLVLNSGVLDGVEASRRARTLCALHGVLAAGAAAAPLVLAQFAGGANWMNAVRGVAVVIVLLAGATILSSRSAAPSPSPSMPPRDPFAHAVPLGAFRTWALAAFLYGVAEATFANWAILFLRTERGLEVPAAARALSAFWFAMAIGRLTAGARGGFGSLRARVAGHAFAMAILFAVIASVRAPSAAAGLYFVAGLACSAAFPWILSAAAASGAGADRAASIIGVAVTLGLLCGSFGVGPFVERFGMETVLRLSTMGPLLLLVLALRSGTGAPQRGQSSER